MPQTFVMLAEEHIYHLYIDSMTYFIKQMIRHQDIAYILMIQAEYLSPFLVEYRQCDTSYLKTKDILR